MRCSSASRRLDSTTPCRGAVSRILALLPRTSSVPGPRASRWPWRQAGSSVRSLPFRPWRRGRPFWWRRTPLSRSRLAHERPVNDSIMHIFIPLCCQTMRHQPSSQKAQTRCWAIQGPSPTVGPGTSTYLDNGPRTQRFRNYLWGTLRTTSNVLAYRGPESWSSWLGVRLYRTHAQARCFVGGQTSADPDNGM